MAKPKLKKKVKVQMPLRNVEDIIYELDSLREKKKLIDIRDKELKADLAIILGAEGVKDSKGSFKMIVGDKLAQRQARKSVKLNKDRAEGFLKSIGIWEEVIEIKEELNESYVEQAFTNGKFTMDDLEAMSDVKTTYAIVINDYKPEEDMPEVEVGK